MFRVNDIFISYMGEQNYKGVGHPVIFVRFSGCNVRCTYCDTPEALNSSAGTKYSIVELVDYIKELSKLSGVKDICITGGEPLLQKSLIPLLMVLQDEHHIFIETSGTISVESVVKYRKNISLIIDYKLPSSNVKIKNFILENNYLLTSKDVLKFVIADYDYDYKEAVSVVKDLKTEAKIVFGIVWEKLTINTLIEWLVKDKLFGKIALNIQVHKYTETK